MNIFRIITGRFRENCYVVVGKNKTGVIIDPGEDFEEIEKVVNKEQLQVTAILNTHAHFDHIAAVSKIKAKYGPRFYLHKNDFKLLTQANLYRTVFEGVTSIEIPTVDEDLSEQKSVELDDLLFQVLHTPGHTPGGVCFLIGEHLFCGDTILNEKIGRTDLPGGNALELKTSIETILKLPRSTMLHPGHGEPRTLSEVMEINSEIQEMMS